MLVGEQLINSNEMPILSANIYVAFQLVAMSGKKTFCKSDKIRIMIFHVIAIASEWLSQENTFS